MPTFYRAARLAFVGSLVAGSLRLLGAQNCGPFTDVPLSDPFCPSILQVHSMGISAGTSVSTFGPTLPIMRVHWLAASVRRKRGGSGRGPRPVPKSRVATRRTRALLRTRAHATERSPMIAPEAVDGVRLRER